MAYRLACLKQTLQTFLCELLLSVSRTRDVQNVRKRATNRDDVNVEELCLIPDRKEA